jgi:hypothetical protein
VTALDRGDDFVDDQFADPGLARGQKRSAKRHKS